MLGMRDTPIVSMIQRIGDFVAVGLVGRDPAVDARGRTFSQTDSSFCRPQPTAPLLASLIRACFGYVAPSLLLEL